MKYWHIQNSTGLSKVSAVFYNIHEWLTKKNHRDVSETGEKPLTVAFTQSLVHVALRLPIHHNFILGSMFCPFLPHVSPPFHIGTQVDW
jgi:hypothetical protein